MTREEAIRVLEDNRPSVIFEDEDAQKRMAELCQAIDMAIEALSADVVSREFYEDAVKANIGIVIENRKLKAQIESADAVHGEWIPCSERLPKAEDMYQLPEQRYLCQLEAHGVRKFCVLSRLKGAVSPFWDWYGIAVYDSEVTAWMPLPKPYKGGDDE